jgi:hypothetical protein
MRKIIDPKMERKLKILLISILLLARGLWGWMVKEIAVHFRRSPMRITKRS